ncbi:hypothetical protein HZ994_04180 [Akkermansiaceae bacterium]|nr:hypothetical protein HZ994_04180 [Akkermansiaceae bacterium]
MKAITIKTSTLSLFVLGALPSAAQHQTAELTLPYAEGTLPYSLEIREISLAPAVLPNIHSVAAASWEGEWILMAGRTNGLHGMTGMNAFDPVYENREVWVINPTTRQSWHKSLETSGASGLSADQVDSLSSTNTQYHQQGETLVIAGGYGYRRSVSDHRTYDTLSAVNLPGIVAWVKEAAGAETSMASAHIRQISDPYFQVTGGALEKLGTEFQLVFGQKYAGRYRPNFNGVYTRQVRRFEMGLDASGNPVVPAASKMATPADDAYRRRDLNVVPIVRRTGLGEFEEAAMVLSGVFTPENGVWTLPVLIGQGGSVSMQDPGDQASLKQAFQIYHCAKTTLYQRANDECHMILFGGLTILERELVGGSFVRDDQAPFTNQCSAVVRSSDGSLRQYWLHTRFPLVESNGKELRFGTNAEFFPKEGLRTLAPKVLDLTVMNQPLVIGHIFGGIVADAGNGGNTGASGRVFEVVLTPNVPETALSIRLGPGELTWGPLPVGTSILVEESADLIGWRELATGLTAGVYGFDETKAAQKFFRIYPATEATP